MRLRSIHLAIGVAVLVLGSVGIASLAGLWQTEGSRVPRVIANGDAAGSFDPADIRGSYTFGDIEASFGVPAALLAEALGVVTESPELYQVKDLENASGEPVAADEAPGYEVGTDTVRLIVALLADLPYEAQTTTGLPAAAYRILAATDSVDQERLIRYADRLVGVETASPSPAETVSGGASGAGVPSDSEEAVAVRGRTTFAELLDYGVTKEQIEEVLGRNMPARGVLVRDFATEQGVEFSDWRNAFQALLDELQD